MSHHPPEPPPGPPWDEPLAEAPLCFLDLEMTGLHARDDRVIEICVERCRGERVEARLATLVRPESGAFGNAHIHGIEPTDLLRAPSFAEIAPEVEAILAGGIPVAHAASWDVAFLEAELARAGRPQKVGPFLDTLALSRRSFSFASHRLSALCEEMGIERARAHRAGDDVAALRSVFGRILGVLAPATPRDLWHVRVGQGYARPTIVAAVHAARARGAPVTIRYRPAHRGPEDLRYVVTDVREDLDPPRVLGYLLPSRSRRELRADRILAIEPAP